ncbi:MAG: YlcI/YnfO family protein [Fimbriimonadales bacterium]
MPDERGATTIRIPLELVHRARRVKSANESFNDLVVVALEREVRRRQALQTYAVIQKNRQRIEARIGPHPDSVPLIRSMREDSPRREDGPRA